MTVPILTLMVLVVAFGAEVGWLMAEPHNLQNCEIVRRGGLRYRAVALPQRAGPGSPLLPQRPGQPSPRTGAQEQISGRDFRSVQLISLPAVVPTMSCPMDCRARELSALLAPFRRSFIS